jgi:hypothetical protein
MTECSMVIQQNHTANTARVRCKRHLKHQPIRCSWLQNHMRFREWRDQANPVLKVSEEQNIPNTRPTTQSKKCWFYNFYSSSRMITIDHIYTLRHCCQHNLHGMFLPQIHARIRCNHTSPRIRTQGTNQPELHHYPNLAVRTQEFQSQSPWGW